MSKLKLNKSQKAISDLNSETIHNALKALARYERRQLRLEHPEGTFDNAKRWYPSSKEDCGVSLNVRSPSRYYPFSYMNACRTLIHCCDLEEVEYEDMLKVRRAIPNHKEIYFNDADKVNELHSMLIKFTKTGEIK